MRLILVYIVNGLSLLEVAAIAKVKGIAEISDVGFMLRFNNCNSFFKEVLKKIQPEATASYRKPEWLERYTVKIGDASVVSSGGKVRVVHRLHYAINPFEMKSESYKITEESVGESLVNYEVSAGDLYICDRAYGKPTSMKYCRECGGDFIFRIKKGAFDIYSSKRTKMNLITKLKALKDDELLDYNCYYKSGKKEYTPVRICAMKKPKNSKDIDETDGDTAFMNNYIVVATSLNKAKISATQIFEAYRIRWQVELYFKRLKSLLSFGDIPTKTKENTETWLHGKLLAAILLELEAASVDFSPVG
jgi:IS4 transposase